MSELRNLSRLSRSELLMLKQQLDSEIVAIKTQLDQARLMRQETGQFAERGWYTRATHALRSKGLKSQTIQNELARRKAGRPHNLETHFMNVARQRLTGEVFAGILAEARELNTETEPS